jgi:hypothetical protein
VALRGTWSIPFLAGRRIHLPGLIVGRDRAGAGEPRRSTGRWARRAGGSADRPGLVRRDEGRGSRSPASGPGGPRRGSNPSIWPRSVP